MVAGAEIIVAIELFLTSIIVHLWIASIYVIYISSSRALVTVLIIIAVIIVSFLGVSLPKIVRLASRSLSFIFSSTIFPVFTFKFDKQILQSISYPYLLLIFSLIFLTIE
ncbi:MAG: hypothetical protein EZS28_042716, partial [Streblomastix strix]